MVKITGAEAGSQGQLVKHIHEDRHACSISLDLSLSPPLALTLSCSRSLYPLSLSISPPLSPSHTNAYKHTNIPIRGMESDVAGIISATSNMKTVRDSSTVIPGGKESERQRNGKLALMLRSI